MILSGVFYALFWPFLGFFVPINTVQACVGRGLLGLLGHAGLFFGLIFGKVFDEVAEWRIGL